MTDLLNYQFEYHGLRFGNGTYFGIKSVDGLDSFSVRRNDSDVPRGHGSIPAPHYMEERDVVFSISIDRNEFDEVEQALEEFKQIFKPSEFYDPDQDFLLAKLPGREAMMLKARPIGTPVVREAVPGAHIITLTAAFISNDPRVYSAEESSVNMNPFASTSLKLDFPIDFSTDWPSGSEVEGSEGVAENNGNSYAWPLLRIHGPSSGQITRVILQNLTYDTQLVINTPILNNQVLHADMEAIVTANGKLPVTVDGDNRYHGWELPRDPFYIGPGSNIIRLSVEGDAEGVVGVVTWRHTSY